MCPLVRQVHNLKAATLQDSTQAASSTTPLSRKKANEWWASPDNMLNEVPTLQELKIAKTVGLKAITRAVAKMYQLVLFRDSADIDPKLVLKIVLAFCKQNNKFDADHYDALVADDGKELMLLTNELMATPQGKAYISELAREVRAVAPSLRCSPTLPRAEHPSLRPFPFSSTRALATSQGRKETYSDLYTILFNIFYDGVKPRDMAAMHERHAYLFHHQEGEKDEEALFPICHAFFRMTTTDDDSQEFSFPSKELHEAAKQLSTLIGNFTPGEPNQDTEEREPLVTANLLALCALVRPAPASPSRERLPRPFPHASPRPLPPDALAAPQHDERVGREAGHHHAVHRPLPGHPLHARRAQLDGKPDVLPEHRRVHARIPERGHLQEAAAGAPTRQEGEAAQGHHPAGRH